MGDGQVDEGNRSATHRGPAVDPVAGRPAGRAPSRAPSVSLCGLGNMGIEIAGQLVAAAPLAGPGQPLRAFDLAPDRVAAAVRRHGVSPVDDVTGLAPADVVVLSLPAPAASRAVMAALAPRLAPGSVIVETSTVNPSDIADQARLAAPHGVGVVDAAILSGVAQMAGGTATLLVGGDPAHLDRAAPVLAALGASVLPFGAAGNGMAAKVINNAVAHAVMVVLVEAGALAAAAGVPGRRLAELLGGPEAGLTRPLTHRFVDRILAGRYDGGMPTEAARKDSTLALALAQQTGVPLFAIHSAHTVYELALAEGLGRHDYAAIATLWEAWTGRSLVEAPAPRAGEAPAPPDPDPGATP